MISSLKPQFDPTAFFPTASPFGLWPVYVAHLTRESPTGIVRERNSILQVSAMVTVLWTERIEGRGVEGCRLR
jgi:hypothetical protein